MHSVPHLANGAFYAGFEHSGNTCRSSKLITGSRKKPAPNAEKPCLHGMAFLLILLPAIT